MLQELLVLVLRVMHLSVANPTPRTILVQAANLMHRSPAQLLHAATARDCNAGDGDASVPADADGAGRAALLQLRPLAFMPATYQPEPVGTNIAVMTSCTYTHPVSDL
jgi:hypothetical protein